MTLSLSPIRTKMVNHPVFSGSLATACVLFGTALVAVVVDKLPNRFFVVREVN